MTVRALIEALPVGTKFKTIDTAQGLIFTKTGPSLWNPEPCENDCEYPDNMNATHDGAGYHFCDGTFVEPIDMQRHRWANPSDWISYKIDNWTHEQVCKDFRRVLRTLDFDHITDLYQDEMSDYGFFVPLTTYPSCRYCNGTGFIDHGRPCVCAPWHGANQ